MRLIVALLLFITLACAEQKAEKTYTYKEALALYKKKQYDEAFAAFIQLLETNFASVEYNYYLARSAFYIKEYNEAISAYERILINYPDNERAKLELGRIYFLLKQYTLSKKYFSEVLSGELPDAVRTNVRSYLAQMHEEKLYSSLTGMIYFGLNYDSNVYNNTYYEQYVIPSFGSYGTLNYNNTANDKQDWAHQEILSLSHLLDTSKQWGFAIKNDITFFARTLEDYSDRNIRFVNYTPALAWKAKNTLIDAGITFDSMWFAGELFLKNIGGIVKYSYLYENGDVLTAQFKQMNKNYTQSSYQDRDARFSELNLIYQKRYSALASWYLKEQIQVERKKGGLRTDVSFDSTDTLVGYNRELQKRWKLDTSISYKKLFYKDSNTFFLKKQEDERWMLTVALQHYISKTLIVQAITNGIDNSSNIEPYNYEKLTFSLNVMKKF